MTNDPKKLALAREWAESMNAKPDVYGWTTDRSRAAAEVILSLPDTIVDGDKLREVIEQMQDSLYVPAFTRHEGEHNSEISRWKAALEALLPDPPAPRPEDVPVGEVWKVEVYGETAVGFRNDPEDRWPWCVTYQVNSRSDWLDDNAVKLIARLVPETTEQNEEPDIDPDCIYIDRDGDKWEYIDGAWITGDTHANRVANRELSPGRDSLPEWFGPYTRIEKGTNE